jgi:hypothetical protein
MDDVARKLGDDPALKRVRRPVVSSALMPAAVARRRDNGWDGGWRGTVLCDHES